MSRKIFRIKGKMCGVLVIFHGDLAVVKTETPQEDGGISEGIKSLLTYIENNPGERIKVIALEINRPAKTIERWIKKLQDEGKVEFRGSKKTGGYYFRRAHL